MVNIEKWETTSVEKKIRKICQNRQMSAIFIKDMGTVRTELENY